MKIISNKEYEIIKLKQDNNKLYIQELEKRIVEISGANKCYKLENRRLRKKIDKALELLDSYKLGKYDYALTPAGLLELEDILRGDKKC